MRRSLRNIVAALQGFVTNHHVVYVVRDVVALSITEEARMTGSVFHVVDG